MPLILLILANIFIYISCLGIVTAQQGPKNWTVSPFNAPALPLAVRSPYLNIWLAQGNDPQELSNIDPRLWPMNKVRTSYLYSKFLAVMILMPLFYSFWGGMHPLLLTTRHIVLLARIHLIRQQIQLLSSSLQLALHLSPMQARCSSIFPSSVL